MPIVDLPLRYAATWNKATRHPFLLAVRDGTASEAAFETWLVQDHHFVSDLLGFQRRLQARAPRHAQAVLAGGVVALVDELGWFEKQAAARRLDLDTPAVPATAAYAALLGRLQDADVAVALAALWAIERVYLDAWSFAAPGAPAYRDFVAHWTTPQFAAYVDALEQTADGALGIAGEGPVLDAVFAEVVAAECRFWDTAVGDTAVGDTAPGHVTSRGQVS